MTVLPLLVALALGQQPTALSGVVTDPSGAVVAGAVVTVSFDDTRQELHSAADGTWTWRLFDDTGRVTAQSRWKGKDLVETNTPR